MTKYEELLLRKRHEWGKKFDSSHLSPKFVEHYNSGARIEVKTMGEVKRGRIGVTTGWGPTFLLMLTKRSLGSGYTLSDKDEVLRVICD